MQLHDILQLRTSVILPEAISDGGLAAHHLILACFSPPIEVGVISHADIFFDVHGYCYGTLSL